MRRLARLSILALALPALAQSAPAPASPAGPAIYKPNENLVADGLPPVPQELADRLVRYTNTRTASLQGWHPARRELLISTRFADTAQLHAVAMPLGYRRQLTFGAERISSGHYCPPAAGDCLIFTRAAGGNEQDQLYRLDFATGEITRLSDGAAKFGEPLWNRAGTAFAYRSTQRNGRDEDIWVMDPRHPEGARMVHAASGAFGASDWSFDDRQLLLVEFISANQSRLHVLDVASGKIRRVAPAEGETVAYNGALFARDGRHLITASDRGGEFLRLVMIDLQSGAERPLGPRHDWDVEDYALTRDGRTLAYLVNDDGRSRLHLLDMAGEKPLPARGVPEGQISGIRWRPDGRELAFNFMDAQTPHDVFSYAPAGGKVSRWTAGETGGMSTAEFPAARLIHYPSFDGRSISAFVYPAHRKFTGPRPVLIDFHGGPEGQSQQGYLGRRSYFTNELGITYIQPNVRGSTGYGKTFLALDNGFKREDSVRDAGALLDWIGTQPGLDKTRVMVSGGSYGGYMTLACLMHYSDRLRGGIDEVGPSHFATFLKNTADYRRDLRRVEYGDEREPAMAEFFEKIAPLNHADRITAPLFVVQGKNDPRVPWTEAEQIVAKVRANGKPVWYLMAKDEGHGFVKKKNADYLFLAQILFLQEYLLK